MNSVDLKCEAVKAVAMNVGRLRQELCSMANLSPEDKIKRAYVEGQLKASHEILNAIEDMDASEECNLPHMRRPPM